MRKPQKTGRACGQIIGFLLGTGPLTGDMTSREEFLAGERPDDIAFFLHRSAISNDESLPDSAETVENGVVVVRPGETGQRIVESLVGIDPMKLAQQAMDTQGRIDHTLAGGTCPDSDEDGEHTTKFVFAFVEGQNEDVGGLYAQGDVVHAYGKCSCGVAYSEKWVAGPE